MLYPGRTRIVETYVYTSFGWNSWRDPGMAQCARWVQEKDRKAPVIAISYTENPNAIRITDNNTAINKYIRFGMISFKTNNWTFTFNSKQALSSSHFTD